VIERKGRILKVKDSMPSMEILAIVEFNMRLAYNGGGSVEGSEP